LVSDSPGPLRIALASTLGTPVRRVGSASIESHVWLLARELTALGHDVTVFAAAGSDVAGRLIATVPGPYGSSGAPNDWHVCEWINLARAFAASRDFDVVHTHAYLWGMVLDSTAPVPALHTLHITPGDDEIRLWSLYQRSRVVALSQAQWAQVPGHRPVATILHGIDIEAFPFREDPDDYVTYLGSFTAAKGPLDAIAAAQKLGIPIRLAGPANEYFRAMVEPHVDGTSVEYVGFVSGSDRATLLGGARALLYPVQYPEPFGLVMPEAMACGTPVAAISVGAVPEIVDDGVTGSSVATAEELATAATRALDLDRWGVRARAEDRFTGSRMAQEYDELYRAVAASRGGW
jgi:glycosyltransferase involved in cell wall biosynthesis